MPLKMDWDERNRYGFAIYERVSWPLGVWPEVRTDLATNIRWCIVMITQISMMASLSIEMYLNCADAEESVDTYIMNSCAVVVVAKLLVLRIHRGELLENVNSAQDDLTTIDEEEESREIVLRYAETRRTVTMAVIGTATFANVLFFFRFMPDGEITTIANSTSKALVLEKRYFLPTSCLCRGISTRNHVLVVAVQLLQAWLNCAGNCIGDVLFFGLTMHLCSQFEILRKAFAKLGEKGESERRTSRWKENKNNREKNREKGDHDGVYLKGLVKRHLHLLTLAKSLETAFNMILLAQLTMSGLLICVSGFRFLVSLQVGDVVSMLKSVVIASFMLMQSFLYSYASDHLRCLSEDLAFATYDSHWYNFTFAGKTRDLTFVIVRANNPVNITAGKFFNVTRGTFMDILKTSASYLSVLRVSMEY